MIAHLDEDRRLIRRPRERPPPPSDRGPMTWWIAGTYLESCNCEVICPCRRIGGRQGGRSTFGVCTGALSWAIERGHADDVDLSGLAVVLAARSTDGEPGSPWDFVLSLDERAAEPQRAALEAIFTGQA